MMFFGPKTVSWFDIWSLEHFFSGIAIGSVCAFVAERFVLRGFAEVSVATRNRVTILTVLTAEYMWEGIEFYLEAGYSGIHVITYWLQGVEFWGNRLITDPLITVAGSTLGLHCASLIWPARIFSLTFLLTHLFVFPHCMYLQELIPRIVK